MKKEFIDTINNHELLRVRIMLTNELLLDPRGKSFDEMLKYAEEKLPDLYEDNNSETLDVPSDKSLWTPELLSKIKRGLSLNFSREKVAIFKELAMYVGQEKAKKLDEEERVETQKAETEHGTKNEPHAKSTNTDTATTQRRLKEAGTAAVVGGAAVSVAGICLSKTILAIAGGVVVAGGIAALVMGYNIAKTNNK